MADDPKTSVFWLRARPPFRLDLTAWAIRRRPENKIDVWDGATYTRVLAIDSRAAKISVQQGSPSAPLRVVAAGVDLNSSLKAKIIVALERLLGIRIDLRPFYAVAHRDPRLSELCNRFQGLKPPRFPTVFEALVNGIACQQLSLTVGIILLNRLSEAYGIPYEASGQAQHAFPMAEDLAAAQDTRLRQLGFSSNKSRALIELACSIASGSVPVESFVSCDDNEAILRLLAIRGIGRWTAEYVLLRGLGRTNIFPGDDVGARNNLARWLKLRRELDYSRVAHNIAKWKPYGGLIYFHLLMDSLERAGYIHPSAPL